MANIIIMGPQGCGKGTHGARISENYKIPMIVTGDLLRAEIANKSPIGLEVENKITNGELISDELVLQMLTDKLNQKDCQNGYILDGFPRTLNQVHLLEDYLEKRKDKIDLVLYLDIPEEESKKRISGRITCEDCNKIYNTETYSKDNCQECEGKLFVRDDDKPEAIEKRLKLFKEETIPVKHFYQQKEKAEARKIVEVIDMMGSIPENRKKLDLILNAFEQRQEIEESFEKSIWILKE